MDGFLLGASLAVDIALNARELIPFVGIDDQSPVPIMSAAADAYQGRHAAGRMSGSGISCISVNFG
jgi:hypothetical protein